MSVGLDKSIKGKFPKYFFVEPLAAEQDTFDKEIDACVFAPAAEPDTFDKEIEAGVFVNRDIDNAEGVRPVVQRRNIETGTKTALFGGQSKNRTPPQAPSLSPKPGA